MGGVAASIINRALYILTFFDSIVVNPLKFLSDSTGRQVTPLILEYGTPDPLPLNAGASPTRAYHRAHGNSTLEQKARAVEQSLRFHRQTASATAGLPVHQIQHMVEVVIPEVIVPDSEEDSDSDGDEDGEEDMVEIVEKYEDDSMDGTYKEKNKPKPKVTVKHTSTDTRRKEKEKPNPKKTVKSESSRSEDDLEEVSLVGKHEDDDEGSSDDEAVLRAFNVSVPQVKMPVKASKPESSSSGEEDEDEDENDAENKESSDSASEFEF